MDRQLVPLPGEKQTLILGQSALEKDSQGRLALNDISEVQMAIHLFRDEQPVFLDFLGAATH